MWLLSVRCPATIYRKALNPVLYLLGLLVAVIVWLGLLGVISRPTDSTPSPSPGSGVSPWSIRRLGPSLFTAGVTATGGPLLHRFPGDHRLVAGVTRSGKSCTVHAIVAAFAPIADAAFVGIDLKRTELGLWAPRFTQNAVDLDDIDQAIVNAVRLMKVRQQFLELQGLTKWTTNLGPWLFIIIDEYAELVGISTDGIDRTAEGSVIDKAMKRSKALASMRITDIASLARVGAGLGIKLIVSTQYPTTEVLDSQIRNQLDTRILHRVTGDEQVRVGMGAGRSQVVAANSIPADMPGGLWIVGSEDYNAPTMARSTYIPADRIPGIATRTAHLSWTWDQLLSLQTVADRKGQT